MLIGFFTILFMGVVAYAYWREGPLTAFAMCCNTFVAGLIAFNFWEPIADALEPPFAGNFLKGTEDALALMALFIGVLALLRWVTNTLASTYMEYPTLLNRGGALLFGLLTGYLAAGFLVCVLQTLPWPRNFLTFETYEPGKTAGLRRYLPPDMVWLAMMHRLSGTGSLATKSEASGKLLDPNTFDRHGNFEMRYHRYRRTDEKGDSLPPRNDLEP